MPPRNPHGPRPPVVIRGGRVIDSTGSRTADILIMDGVISTVGSKVSSWQEAHERCIVIGTKCSPSASGV